MPGVAIDYFVDQIGRSLGSLVAVLKGLDALVFTAGIGEHSAEIRARVCRDANWLGVALDDEANCRGGPRISKEGCSPSAWVIPTDEELMIARHTLRLIDASTTTDVSPDVKRATKAFSEERLSYFTRSARLEGDSYEHRRVH